ncbi:phosphotransferase [Kutzneria sp. NPDC052558]|uniref:phosphotransferase n=1 Tax=Kutzneria sp. NPDC052558 TaxID=3364121 RepID=UPI0037C55349
MARVMAAVAGGDAERFDGRGVNASYRVGPLSVKVHHPAMSSGLTGDRIRLVDSALRGAPWYPPVLDLGWHGLALVVVRPFAEGRPADDGRRHVGALAGVLAGLSERADGLDVAEELIADYASPWLADTDRELAQTLTVLGEHTALAEALRARLPGLAAAASRLSGVDASVHHGDLHGRNLVFAAGRCTVIDWDETGFSRRPADAAKAMWLSCRRARGDFELDHLAVQRFLRAVPGVDAVDLARLGALWFVPSRQHVTLLGQRDASLALWYLGWVSRFWSRLGRNLDMLSELAG